MLPLRKWGALMLSFTLALSVLSACGTADDKDAKAKDEAAQAKDEAVPADQNQQPNGEENPVPIVDVNLGMDPQAVVAEYEGGKITAEQFESYLAIQSFINPQAGLAIHEKLPESLKLFIESYVSEIIMAERAPDVSNAEKEATELVDRIKGQYLMVLGGDEKKVEKQMQDQKVTDEGLKEFFVRYKKVEAYLRSQVTEEEIKKRYDEGKGQGDYTVASVRHILVSVGEQPMAPAEGEKKALTDEEAKKLADELSDRLRKGEDFAALAKEYSDDPGSKETGGLYEDVEVAMWVPEFKKAAIELPLNEISDPVKTDYGYHVMKVEKRTEKSYEDVADQIRSQFVNEKYDAFMEKELEGILKNVNLPEKKE
ncbi:peptidylprolyl isomerase [Ammoniphilus sp. CFH 90114]|uniref:peptidylprolyl isomerase n=1 Tax=Ammoniphilus sp. CFH 90114 TaxID=2493665 RepID=UPI00100F32FC|nr:peptidylprolyl isomerase [Ammoniphilus sp. CFH 90114]RXT09008.1 foldase [Ammoniphilus sp. CFH 90114]